MSESRLRLLKQLNSSIFSNDSSIEAPQKTMRKVARTMSSDFFSISTQRNSTPNSSYLKPRDHDSSDFFGNFPSDYYRKDVRGTYNSLASKPVTTKCFDKINKKYHEKSFEPHITPLTKQFSNNLNKNPSCSTGDENIKLESISISGLTPHDDENTVKNLCKGLHIVQIAPEIDNVTGKCSGRATLQLRTNSTSADIEKFKLKLVEKGYRISSISTAKGKKNNYSFAATSFLNSHLQSIDKRLNPGQMSSYERKLAMLSTSDDLFGGSSGTGRIHNFKATPNNSDSKNSLESLRKWDILKNTPHRNIGYSKPTISSNNKLIFRSF